MAERLPIAWNGRLVGWIESPRIDYPHFYGRWTPADHDEAEEFLRALRGAVVADEGLEVCVFDKFMGIIYGHPADDEGNIDVRWTL